VPITQKTRDADEKLREELRNADIGKLKKLMAPLIERVQVNNTASEKKSKSRSR